ncbi:transmembrane protein 134 isoform X1 [Meriones unguiculatus]|uniref:transmembrane protein 134 isoform X1 n=1 Tax=Meriones unguiculatus TaxID=10047 RepID=UPI00293F4CB1|nr:transmembrane protein 134 isoform X1 [Meriones unguiculatus]
MSASRPQFSIDDAFELTLEDAGPGPESSGVARFGPLHFERRARFEVADEDKQSRLRYQNLENDEDGAQASPEPEGGVSTRDSGHMSIRSSQWSFSTISSTTQRSYNACCSWTQHPLIQKNRRVVLASFLLLLLGLVLILVGVGLEVAPSPGVASAIFFVPGVLLLVPGGESDEVWWGTGRAGPGPSTDRHHPTVYHVIFIYCAVKGRRGFQFFYLPYFEK